MDGKGRTLAVAMKLEVIKNLTNKAMWTYGTSGEIIELPPAGIDVKAMDLSDLKYNTYYIADKKIKDILLGIDPQFGDHIIKPVFTGKGREGERLYRFTRPDGKAVALITEDNGKPGETLYVSNF